MRRPIVVLVFATLVVAPQARVHAATTTKNVSGTITGNFDKGTVGTCATGYAKQCASGTCKFNQFTGSAPKGHGTIGTGTVIDMCVTTDVGNGVTPADADADDKQTCLPFFGDLVYQTTKNNVRTAVNLAGVVCHHQATSKTDLIEAGFGIDGANSDDPTLTGWGTVTGTVAKDTGAFSLKISGSATTASP